MGKVRRGGGTGKHDLWSSCCAVINVQVEVKEVQQEPGESTGTWR